MSTSEERAVAVRRPVIQFQTARLTDDQMALVTRTVARGATPDELAMFFHVCNKVGLDPFLRQIHSVKRRVKNDDTNQWEWGRSIQVGIDGLRLVAERTKRYAPDEEPPRYDYDDQGDLVKATVFVKKQTEDGTWHRIPGEAYFDEYAQYKRDKELTHMWAEKPHVMLSKCAEAQALRKAFPNETSGLYIHEELPEPTARDSRAPKIGTPVATTDKDKGKPAPAQVTGEPIITEKQRRNLWQRWKDAEHSDDAVRVWLQKKWGVASTKQIPVRLFDVILKRFSKTIPLLLDGAGEPSLEGSPNDVKGVDDRETLVGLKLIEPDPEPAPEPEATTGREPGDDDGEDVPV